MYIYIILHYALNNNKKAHWPLVAHLRITVYRGIGKHGSPLSPAMNLDRSAVSLRLYLEKFHLIMLTKLKGCRTSTFLYTRLSKIFDLRGGAIFGPKVHNLNKLRRASFTR